MKFRPVVREQAYINKCVSVEEQHVQTIRSNAICIPVCKETMLTRSRVCRPFPTSIRNISSSIISMVPCVNAINNAIKGYGSDMSLKSAMW